ADPATNVRKILRSAFGALDFFGIEADVLCAAVRPFRVEKPLFSLLECKCKLRQHENVAALERVRNRFGSRSLERGMPARNFERDEFSHRGRLAWQGGRAHQEFIDGARALTPLANGPDDQRLPAGHVARSAQ